MSTSSNWRTLGRDEFDTWHAAEKAARGYPVRGRNAQTGALQPVGVGMTTEIVAPIQVDATDVRFDAVGVVAEEKDDKGIVVKALPGRVSWEPKRLEDGKIDVAASKLEPVKEEIKVDAEAPIEGALEPAP